MRQNAIANERAGERDRVVVRVQLAVSVDRDVACHGKIGVGPQCRLVPARLSPRQYARRVPQCRVARNRQRPGADRPRSHLGGGAGQREGGEAGLFETAEALIGRSELADIEAASRVSAQSEQIVAVANHRAGNAAASPMFIDIVARAEGDRIGPRCAIAGKAAANATCVYDRQIGAVHSGSTGTASSTPRKVGNSSCATGSTGNRAPVC